MFSLPTKACLGFSRDGAETYSRRLPPITWALGLQRGLHVPHHHRQLMGSLI